MFLIFAILPAVFLASFVYDINDSQLALATAFFTVSGGMVTYKHEKRKEVESRLFEKKVEAYKPFFDLMDSLFGGGSSQNIKQVPQQKVDKKLRELRQGLLIWGSDESLEAMNQLSCMEGKEPREGWKMIENMYRVLRKDLGHEDKFNSEYAIFSSFLNPEGKQELLKGKENDRKT